MRRNLTMNSVPAETTRSGRVFHGSMCASVRTYSLLKEKTFRLKNRSKRGEQIWADQTHKRKEIKIFWPPLFNICKRNFVDFAFFVCVRATYEKCKNYKFGMHILNNGGQKIFISFLLWVWSAQICSPRLDLFFNRKVFSFNLTSFFFIYDHLKSSHFSFLFLNRYFVTLNLVVIFNNNGIAVRWICQII